MVPLPSPSLLCATPHPPPTSCATIDGLEVPCHLCYFFPSCKILRVDLEKATSHGGASGQRPERRRSQLAPQSLRLAAQCLRCEFLPVTMSARGSGSPYLEASGRSGSSTSPSPLRIWFPHHWLTLTTKIQWLLQGQCVHIRCLC
jgi:hypothetical protein